MKHRKAVVEALARAIWYGGQGVGAQEFESIPEESQTALRQQAVYLLEHFIISTRKPVNTDAAQ